MGSYGVTWVGSHGWGHMGGGHMAEVTWGHMDGVTWVMGVESHGGGAGDPLPPPQPPTPPPPPRKSPPTSSPLRSTMSGCPAPPKPGLGRGGGGGAETPPHITAPPPTHLLTPPPPPQNWGQASQRLPAALQPEEGEVQEGRLLLEEAQGRQNHARGSHEAEGAGGRGTWGGDPKRPPLK